MAYDKIIVIRSRLDRCLDYVQNDGKTDLGDAVDYICNPVKAGFQTAINCMLDKAFLQMQATKQRWDKCGGILGYTEAELMQRLNEQRHEPEPTPPVFSAQKRYTVRRRPCRYPPVKRGSFRALYLYYLYLLSPHKRKPQKIPFETRAEIRRAKQYRQQFFLLQKYHIDTKPELEMLSDALSNEMQIIADWRKELYALRRDQPSEQLDEDIDSLTAQLRPLRRELRLCGKIAEYAPRMLQQVQESNLPPTENHAPDKARERRHSLWR